MNQKNRNQNERFPGANKQAMLTRQRSRSNTNRRKPRSQRAKNNAAVKHVPVTPKPEKSVSPLPADTKLLLPPFLTVRDLAQLMHHSPIDVIKKLMALGVMANINQSLDFDTASIVAEEMGFEVEEEKPDILEQEEKEQTTKKTLRQRILEAEKEENLQVRPPVVAVLGHVDHGKTTLLDAIRRTHVASREAGGITQHMGAYQVTLPTGESITFLDTPGHEAFTAMRARGAQATDIAVLVVAADDGIMPQTKEAINHIKAAQVPMIVALNKIDKPNANVERVKQQLADLGFVPEEWGGDQIIVPMSAKHGKGVEDLLENILLVVEVIGIKANPEGQCVGTVIEGRLDRSRGVTVTLLVQNGTLHTGDSIVIGDKWGRVRAMFNDKGQPIKEALPAMPVSILGFSEVPEAGEIFQVVPDERLARSIVQKRKAEAQAARTKTAPTLTLDQIFDQVQQGKVKTLNLIIRADVQGSLEPLISSLEQISTEEVHLKVLHQAVGNVTESDVLLATASKAVILAFRVGVDPAAAKLAEANGVDIRHYDVIYTLVDDVERALKGMLEPIYEERTIGKAEVKEMFHIRKVGSIAGSHVLEGYIQRNSLAKVYRQGQEIGKGRISSLKRFTEDVSKVKAGFECGIGIEGVSDLHAGDIIEALEKVRVR